MKKYLIGFAALTLTLAIALPSFAVEFKYGGLFRSRLQFNNNVTDGQDNFTDGNTNFFNDNQTLIDQRLRLFFTFIASENLQLVTKYEEDTLWGHGTGGRHGGGRVGADEVNIEMKNAYIDFAIPTTPIRTKIGVQSIALMDGWVLGDDFSAAVVEAKLDPVKVEIGYIAAKNDNVTQWHDRVDEYYLSVGVKQGPFSGSLMALYQYAHDTDVTPFGSNTSTVDPGLGQPGVISLGTTGTAATGGNTVVANGFGNRSSFFTTSGASSASGAQGVFNNIQNNNFIDLGLNLNFKNDLVNAYVTFIKNLGGFDNVAPVTSALSRLDDDYSGWMVEAGANVFCGPFTFNLGGFYTSGGDIENPDQFGDFFRYPAGRSHYWSEIMGLGTFDTNVTATGADDRLRTQAGYAAADGPSNLWTLNAGAAWQALEGTKLTFNYYYLAAAVPVVAGFDLVTGDSIKKSSIGHEFDFYLDQKIVDKLMLRLVGAYLIADDALTQFNDDDNIWEAGAQLQWAF